MHAKYMVSFLFLTLIISCSPKTWLTADTKYERYEVGEDEGSEHIMEEIIAPYKSQLTEQMEEIIGTAEVSMTKERIESSLGNWMTDILLDEANRLSTNKIDLALQNYGGVRTSSIQQGPITVRKIYELMPFDNMLVVLDVNGDILMKLFDRIADYGGWPISRGVHFEIVEGKAINVTLNGEKIDGDKIYRFAVSDYIANGGDDANFLRNVPQQDFNITIRDAIINNIKRDTEMGLLQFAEKEGRITKAE